MKIIVFGAAFDPPHLGHKLMLETVLKLKLADGVWLLPARHHPFDKILSSQDDRLAMLKTLVVDRVRIEEYELHHEEISYTYRSLCALRALYPEHQFSFLIGSDNLVHFNRWDQYQKLLEEFTFYVYPRVDYPMQPLFPGMIPLTQVKQVDISSTQVRQLSQEGKSIEHLVGHVVAKYIKDHGLYLKDAKKL